MPVACKIVVVDDDLYEFHNETLYRLNQATALIQKGLILKYCLVVVCVEI